VIAGVQTVAPAQTAIAEKRKTDHYKTYNLNTYIYVALPLEL